MDMNGTILPAALDLTSVVDNLRALEVDLAERVQAERTALKQAEAELRQIQQMIRTATGTTAQGHSKGGNKKGSPLSPRYGEEELRIILSRIKRFETPAVDDIPGSFTVGMVAERLGLAKSVADRAVSYLRDQEQVRLVGERSINGQRASRLFVVNEVPSDG